MPTHIDPPTSAKPCKMHAKCVMRAVCSRLPDRIYNLVADASTQKPREVPMHHHMVFVPMGEEVSCVDRVALSLGLTLETYVSGGPVYWCGIAVDEVTEPDHGWVVCLLVDTNDAALRETEFHVMTQETDRSVATAA
jgi:hypothetical protein